MSLTKKLKTDEIALKSESIRIFLGLKDEKEVKDESVKIVCDLIMRVLEGDELYIQKTDGKLYPITFKTKLNTAQILEIREGLRKEQVFKSLSNTNTPPRPSQNS